MVNNTNKRKSADTSCVAPSRRSTSSSITTVPDTFNLDGQLGGSSSEQSSLGCFVSALTRKKPLDCRTDTNLNRCLNLLDLTALGVGSTLGLGLYVLAGQVASNKAGPGVVVSFALAALASAFSALCYAEFAGRVPRAGSAYAYSYITVGEFVAFVIGWNLILEYVISASSVARGFSGYLCFVYEHVVQILTSTAQPVASAAHEHTGWVTSNATLPNQQQIFNASSLIVAVANSTAAASVTDAASQTFVDSISNYLAEYFDWPSVAIIVVFTIFIATGVKGSTNVTMAFTAVNLLVVGVMVISSLGSLDLHNWRLSKSEVPNGYGDGGFLPYGWSGVLAGSATCFFGFIGFDTIASSAEEAKSPKRNVPMSILLSLFISFLAYMSVAVIQTLLWPYYDQNKVTILPQIFSRLEMPLTYWVVLIGAIAGLASSQLGGMYPLPRILYSMAHDRLIYGALAHINRRLKLPVRATIVGSIFVALLSCLLDIQDLADMVSIGTLAAYSLVSLSVLILRYEDRSDAVNDSTIMSNHLDISDILNTLDHSVGRLDFSELKARQIELGKVDGNHNNNADKLPANQSSHVKSKMLQSKDINQIKARGSKELVPQLSNGFQSWFKSEEDQTTVACPTSKETDMQKRPGYLQLLAVWKTDKDYRDQNPDDESSRQSKILISIIVALTLALNILVLCMTNLGSSATLDLQALQEQRFQINICMVLGWTCCILMVALVIVMLMLSKLPVSRSMPSEMFQVPLVPLVPTLGILVNTFLMFNLSFLTWIRFAIWMAIGLFIYFTYGIWNSRGYMIHLDT